MNLETTVRDVARRLRLLDNDERLVLLDSLAITDLIVELETVLHHEIPIREVRQEAFSSIESLVEMLRRVTRLER